MEKSFIKILKTDYQKQKYFYSILSGTQLPLYLFFSSIVESGGGEQTS